MSSGSCSASTDGSATTRTLPCAPLAKSRSSACMRAMLAEHLARLAQQRLAGGGGLDAAPAAHQQRRADLGLDRGDALADRRGDDGLALRRRARCCAPRRPRRTGAA